MTVNLNKIIFVSLVIALPMMTSCHYYTYTVEKQPGSQRLKDLESLGSYLIVHSDSQAFHLKDGAVDLQNQRLTGILEVLPREHKGYLKTKTYAGSTNRYEKRADDDRRYFPKITEEVHVYLQDFVLVKGSEVMIPVSAIHKIEVYDPDKAATVASYVFGATFGLTFTAAFAAALVLITLGALGFTSFSISFGE